MEHILMIQSESRQPTLPVGDMNILDNGDFRVEGIGNVLSPATITNATARIAPRWSITVPSGQSLTAVYGKEAADHPLCDSALKFIISAASVATSVTMHQRVEHAAQLIGDYMTLSFFYKNADNSEAAISSSLQFIPSLGAAASHTSSGLSASPATGPGWREYHFRFTPPANFGTFSPTAGEDHVKINITFPLNLSVQQEITGVRLVRGLTPMPHFQRPYALDELRVRRFLFTVPDVLLTTARTDSVANYTTLNVIYPVVMLRVPTVTFTASNAGGGNVTITRTNLVFDNYNNLNTITNLVVDGELY
jgi:hypothetical protein